MLLLVALSLCGLVLMAAWVDDAPPPVTHASDLTRASSGASISVEAPEPSPEPSPEPTATLPPVRPARLPHDIRRIFADNRMLVAYYGTANTGALGVLGEAPPDRMVRRLRAAAKPFRREGGSVQLVFEMIVSVADATPGRDGDYHHDVARADVERYIRAAHRHQALLLLDIQPGRAGFLGVAKRWAWALSDPYVGLALDPEWRMGRHGVPGRRIGSVSATEVNRTSAWLRDLVARHHLPQKLFVLHQFRRDMIEDIGQIEPRQGVVMVQHVDGFGTPAQKLDTYHYVSRPGRFVMGFKLFYDEDVRQMGPAQVKAIRPRVQFVSFQ